MKATIGPTVTLYEIVQEAGVKISRIQGLENDIAQSLKALGIRIIAPIPGRGTIGIEVPNRHKEVVSMRSAVQSERFHKFNGRTARSHRAHDSEREFRVRPRQDASPACRGCYGTGQVGRSECHNNVAALSQRPFTTEISVDRPEDGRVLALCQTRKAFPRQDGFGGRGDSNRPEKGGLHAQLALHRDGRASGQVPQGRGAQHRRVQREGAQARRGRREHNAVYRRRHRRVRPTLS